MKRLNLLLLIVFVVSPQAEAADKQAQKIINRYKKAAGGNALKRVKSTMVQGSVRTSDGSTGRFSYLFAAPDNLKISIEAGPLSLAECYNGKSAWRVDTLGLRTLLGDEAKRLRLEALLAATRLRDLPRNRIVPKAAGSLAVDGRQTNIVELAKDGVHITIFFDAVTGLIVKREKSTSGGVEETFYHDYRMIDGVMEPYSITIKRGGTELVIHVERVEHNRPIDRLAFRYPHVEGSKPLPDVEALLRTVVVNQEKIEQLRERYTCRMTEVERKHDGDGRVKEIETRVYEITPVADRIVQRLMSVNGTDLSPPEREKEDRRLQREVEKVLSRHEKKKRKEEQAEARGHEKDDKDEITILDFLHICEVTSVRREVFRGVEVVAFDFEPRKKFKARNRIESVVGKLAGTLWVDEQAGQITRLEARLIDSFKIGGGIVASISPSTAFSFEQERIDGEIWLPSYSEANISARVLLFSKINRSRERAYSDYRKYNVDSTYETTKPLESTRPDRRF